MAHTEISVPTNPLRVLHVVTGLGLGGAETVLSRVIAATPGITHEVICLSGPQWYSDVLEARGIRVHHLNMRSVSTSGLMRIRRLIRDSGPNVIQCWMYRANLLGGLVGRFSGVPTIWNIRCSSLDRLGISPRLVAYAGGALAPWVSDFVINCSIRSSDLHRKLGYGRAPGAVIPNGYDTSQFAPDKSVRKKLREELGISPDTFLIGSISRWDPQKDIHNLLAALRLAADHGVAAKCLLVGGGLDDRNDDLRNEILRCGCSDLVLTVGRRADVNELANAIDLHVLSSITEGFPNVVAETMLSGTPNVVTDVGDAAMIVGDTGWVVPPRDPHRLAQSIESAYNEWRLSPKQWHRREKMARKRVVDNFSLDRMIEAYEDVWRRFAKKGTPAAVASAPA
jgi:glycosyltransferase involved in cell wall biosynthesis